MQAKTQRAIKIPASPLTPLERLAKEHGATIRNIGLPGNEEYLPIGYFKDRFDGANFAIAVYEEKLGEMPMDPVRPLFQDPDPRKFYVLVAPSTQLGSSKAL